MEHLLREIPGIELACSTSAASVPADAARLLPDVIVTSTRMLGGNGLRNAADLRRFSPGSRVVFVTPGQEWEDEGARGWADASLEEEDLVRGLLPIVHILAAERTFG
jgi:DNA-binding NarL/FixJ family response regulator